MTCLTAGAAGRPAADPSETDDVTQFIGPGAMIVGRYAVAG